jgi:hypothetical protein
MTWIDDANKQFEQVMQSYKGTRQNCIRCGIDGEYDKDFKTDLITVNAGFGSSQGGINTIPLELRFICKDHIACQTRQKNNKR